MNSILNGSLIIDKIVLNLYYKILNIFLKKYFKYLNINKISIIIVNIVFNLIKNIFL